MAAFLTTVDDAAAVLADGGVVAVPTDTVYGLVCLPRPGPVARVFDVKRRPADKSVQLLLPDASWLDRIGRPTAAARALASAFWPGAMTLVVAAAEDAPAAVARGGTIGTRVPAHDVALALLEATGPLAATSANHSGDPTPDTIEEIHALFGASVDAYLDGGVIAGSASTVVDASTADVRILREGPVSRTDVTRAVSRPI